MEQMFKMQSLRRTWVPNAKSKSKSKSTLFVIEEEPRCRFGWANRLLGHRFDFLCATVILFNAVLVGFSTEWATQHEREHPVIWALSQVCSVFFILELVLRLLGKGLEFFTEDCKAWNMFDLVLGLLSLLDVALGGMSGVGSAMKTIKMLRVMRLFRVIRFFHDLHMLALMVIDSLKALMWALIMLLLISYVFAVCLTDRVTQLMPAVVGPVAIGYFGSLPRTFYALGQAMMSGVSWGQLTDSLLSSDGFSVFLIHFYVFFTMLAVLNIITGTFVENALELSRQQHDVKTEREYELKRKYTDGVTQLFHHIDADGSGLININELKDCMEDPRMMAYFTALEMDTNDTDQLFGLLDDDGSGDVDIDEFIKGCLKVKGPARAADVLHLTHVVARMEKGINAAMLQLLRPDVTTANRAEAVQPGC